MMHMIKSTNTISQTNKQMSGDWHHPATLPILHPLKTLPSRLIDDEVEEDGEVEVMVAEPDLAEPPMYAVVMYNDDYTPMEFVVYMIFRISPGYLKKVLSSLQFSRQDLIVDGYLLPHFSSNLSNSSNARSSVGAA